jgi:hypothetical protein
MNKWELIYKWYTYCTDRTQLIELKSRAGPCEGLAPTEQR